MDAKIDSKQVDNISGEYTTSHPYKYEAKWFFIPFALGYFSSLFGSLIMFYFLFISEHQKPLVQCAVVDISKRHTVQAVFDVKDFIFNSHLQISNVELRGDAVVPLE